MSEIEYRAEQIAAVAREMSRLGLVSVTRCHECEYCYEDDMFWSCRELGRKVAFVDGTKPSGYCSWASRREP